MQKIKRSIPSADPLFSDEQS